MVYSSSRTWHVVFIRAIFFILFSFPLTAQSQDNLSTQLWIDANPYYFFTPKIEVYGDIGGRWILEGDNYKRVVIRSAVRTPLGSEFFLSGGIGNFININEGSSNVWEIRPFQGLLTYWPSGRLPIQHYLRFEQRIEFDTKNWDRTISTRLRYRMRLSHKLGAIQPDRFWRMTLGWEGFFKLTEQKGQIEEQVRITAGLERNFRKDFRLRLEVTWQKESLKFISNNSVESIYIRLRLYQNLRLLL